MLTAGDIAYMHGPYMTF